MSRAKIVLGVIAGALVAIQLVPVERTNPPVEETIAAPPEIARVLERACYDCHSNATRWPWYTKVAPVSWLVAHDVEEGRHHLNFTTWNRVPPAKLAHKFEEIGEEVGESNMPLKEYVVLHPEARLTDAERAALVSWAKSQEALYPAAQR